MTEDEAKTKWCPQARAVVVGENRKLGFAGNRGVNHDKSIHENPPWARCIGSACMAWRWRMTGDFRAKIAAIKEHRTRFGTTLVEAKDAVEAGWTDHPTDGFCGLAGALQ